MGRQSWPWHGALGSGKTRQLCPRGWEISPQIILDRGRETRSPGTKMWRTVGTGQWGLVRFIQATECTWVLEEEAGVLFFNSTQDPSLTPSHPGSSPPIWSSDSTHPLMEFPSGTWPWGSERMCCATSGHLLSSKVDPEWQGRGVKGTEPRELMLNPARPKMAGTVQTVSAHLLHCFLMASTETAGPSRALK